MLREMLAPALRLTQKINADDVIELALLDLVQVWLATGPPADGDPSGGVLAVAVTEISNFPRQRVLRVILLGGRQVQRWLAFIDRIGAWGREQGCDAIEVEGRRGWERALRGRGFRERQTVIGKELW